MESYILYDRTSTCTKTDSQWHAKICASFCQTTHTQKSLNKYTSEVVPALVRHVPSAHVEPVWDDGKTLREQIQQYLNADVLVLGHGAGMVHSLWLRERATVIEIVPRAKMKLMVKRRTVRRATRRATQKRHKYVGQWEVDGLTLLRDIAPRSIRRITVPDAHSKVAVRKVLRCLPTTLTR